MCGVLSLRRPRDFEDKLGLPGFDDDPKGQERATLALRVDQASELRQNFRDRLEAVNVAVQRWRDVEERAADEIEDRRATLPHFGFRGVAGVIAIAACNAHSLALKFDGSLVV